MALCVWLFVLALVCGKFSSPEVDLDIICKYHRWNQMDII